MGFKQNNNTAAKEFLNKNFNALLENGIPLAIIEDHRNWLYFLDHGHHPDIIWDIRSIDKQQAENLIPLIESFYDDASILYNLRYLAFGPK
ncbi:MAG: hypothetical protein MUD08_06425 [Cytophagales bacterium]|jgi:hypothetical protein|nr:hypothetical protein [Cytophagales bacterium]